MKNIFHMSSICIAILLVVIAGCKKAEDTSTFVSLDTQIDGIETLVNQLSSEQTLPVIFPRLIPRDTQHDKYYLSSEILTYEQSKGYMISVGYTPDCNGVHVCTVGYLMAEQGAELEMLQDHDGKVITTPVKLSDNIEGYYTPGHAMGSYFPPTLQWRKDDVRYTLSWDEKLVDENILKVMADSAK